MRFLHDLQYTTLGEWTIIEPPAPIESIPATFVSDLNEQVASIWTSDFFEVCFLKVVYFRAALT